MAQDLERQGYVYSVVELKNKMHNLTTRYRKEKQKVGPTGGSPSNWNLFQEIQSLLAPYKSYHTEGLLVDSVNNINSQSLCSIPGSPLPSPSAYSASPLPSPSIAATSPLPSPSIPITSPLPSPSIPVISPVPSPPITIASPLPSPNMSEDSPAPSTSARARRKEELANLFKRVERNIETIQKDIKSTSEKFVSIEEEKKEILKWYVKNEAEVQKALIEFLKRP
ncbi:proline-rich protein 12-like [Rhagoletis pomonella]|uniref:proline-rich protein 12-like n=1 Tax=Rhagoletis pomonella TaxID=28610 RepID=UPI00177D4567|nr:proline-rich protein 12-like [Rhagoletis pomonella]